MKTQETISTFLAKQLEILEAEKRIDNTPFTDHKFKMSLGLLSVEEAKQVILALASANFNK